jgi:hypothetical protein
MGSTFGDASLFCGRVRSSDPAILFLPVSLTFAAQVLPKCRLDRRYHY